MTPEEKQLRLIFKVAENTIGMHLSTVKAMTNKEYEEWAKEHVRKNEDGTTTIF